MLVDFWVQQTRSLPVQGAWIEIGAARLLVNLPDSRSPCRERGLKYVVNFPLDVGEVVAPRAGSVD